MADYPIELPAGYTALSVTYKTADNLPLNLDVLRPSSLPKGPVTVLMHIHGGFLV